MGGGTKTLERNMSRKAVQKLLGKEFADAIAAAAAVYSAPREDSAEEVQTAAYLLQELAEKVWTMEYRNEQEKRWAYQGLADAACYLSQFVLGRARRMSEKSDPREALRLLKILGHTLSEL